MPEYGLPNYASPYLRKAVFDRIHPGSQVEYEVVPIADALPAGHADGGGKPEMAIMCTIVMADGTWVTGVKEIDLFEWSKRDRKWQPVEQSPEQFTKDCTKALGRALRDAGIPQKVDELKALMAWHVALTAPAQVRLLDKATGEIVGSDDPDGDDDPDAGVEQTGEQRLAAKFQALDGPLKADISTRAKSELGVTNVMRAGDHADTIEAWIDAIPS